MKFITENLFQTIFGKNKKDNNNEKQIIKKEYSCNNTILINPVISAGTNMDSSLIERIEYTGNNTGNLLFAESIKEQVEYKKEIWINPTDVKDENATVIMPASNFLRMGNEKYLELCQKFLDNTTCPITLAGLGAQSTHTINTPKKLVDSLSEPIIYYFKSLSERATSIGVRGEFTAECLEKMGIHNYRVIGCPSAYKYLDGKYTKLKQPSGKKTVFTTTTGSKYERMLLELAMKSDSTWMMQMKTEMPEVPFENAMPNKSMVDRRYPGLKLDMEELKLFMDKNAQMFFRINDWYKFNEEEKFTFAYGSRFHGNMSALRSGIPTLWLTHDSRTSELVNTLHLPHIEISKLEQIKSVDELIEYCDYSDFYNNYNKLTKNYVEFLEENNIAHKFKI